ncbi:CotH kinase family protein [Planctomycetota bacterium]
MIVKSKPLAIVPNYIKGLTSTPELLIIDVKHINYQKLAFKREEAFAKQHLTSSDDDYVSASIRYQDRKYKVDLRLKGDNTDHLHGDKWSFRVKLKGENSLFGMKKFSIQKPFTRRYINEWIFHEALRREGLLSLRYKFIKVILNGKNLGVYALEEHFDKYLVEHNSRREGPIIRFNEDIYWLDAISGSGSYLSSNINGYKMNKVLADPLLQSQFVRASGLLESFRRGECKTSDVFDVNKMAIHFALATLLGGGHSFHWHNVRFYYNPITSRLESIGFDADAGGGINSLMGQVKTTYVGRDELPYLSFLGMVFSDELFVNKYVQALDKVSRKAYLDKFFEDINVELKQNLAILYGSYPLYYFTPDVFYRNQEFVRRSLNPEKAIHAFLKERDGRDVTLSLGSTQSLPVEIVGLSYKGNEICKLSDSKMLPSKNGLVEYQDVRFSMPFELKALDLSMEELKVTYRLLGTTAVCNESVFAWPYASGMRAEDDVLRQKSNHDTFAFVVSDELNKRILIKPGQWTIDKTLIIGPGYRVVCGEGTELRLVNSASVVSFSPLEFVGSEEKPIIICSPERSGQGVVVLEASEESTLEYVYFTHLSNPSQLGWELTGAVTFYESPVKISQCRFLQNASEDSLNIVRSDFEIDSTVFSDSLSDAFDGDFCKGSIRNTSFVNLGNDAVDVSGTQLELENILVDQARDKGISVGENSSATVAQVTIKNSEIAITSKDMSKISLSHVGIENCKIGFASYQKKHEFGHGSIVAQGVEMQQVEVPYLLEHGSNLTLNRQQVASNKMNVAEMLYGEMYGKSSK